MKYGYPKLPQASVLVERELEDAKRELLRFSSIKEHASCMETYNRNRITRLERLREAAQ